MAQTGASGYASLNARVRVMYSSLFTSQDYARLNEAPDFNALIGLLQHTPYGPYLDKSKDKNLSPRRAAFLLRGRLSDAYVSIIHAAPEYTRDLLTFLFRHFEVNNLKAVLRGIVNGANWDKVRYLLFPMGSMSILPAQEMVEAGSVTAAVELLRGTLYYDMLSYAMKRYSAEQNLFALEVALDLDYWRRLWKEVNLLPRDDRVQALHIIGSIVDTNNLMWEIRYQVFHHLSEEEIINYTLPFGYRVRDEDIRAIAAGAISSQVVERIFPNIAGIDVLLQDPQTGLPELERKLQRQVIAQCQSAFLGNPFHIGVPLAYLVLSEMEIQDLVMMIEAKSQQLPVEKYKNLLLMSAMLN
jgi:V/A-type H+/Na+-transporting ATPase subunit C